MKKVIAVWGKENSGKTTAIVRFARTLKLQKIGRGEITLATPQFRYSGAPLIGIASEGDNAEVLERNIAFFRRCDVDIAVCATRSSGATVDAVEKYAGEYGHKPIWIAAKEKNGSGLETARIVAEILSHL